LSISIKRLIASLLTIFLILFSWIISYEYHCIAIIFPIIILAIISHSFIELKMQERRCLKKCYFKKETIVARILSSRSTVVVVYLILSIMMSITIVSSAIDYTPIWWLYLVVHTLLSLILYRAISYASLSTINSSYHKLFAREWTINGMTLLILPFFIYLSLNSYTPEYLKEGFVETLDSASSTISSECIIINRILTWSRELDALLWWLVYSSATYAKASWIKAIIWIGFIIYNSIALLGINRLIVQIIYIIDIIFKRKNYD